LSSGSGWLVTRTHLRLFVCHDTFSNRKTARLSGCSVFVRYWTSFGSPEKGEISRESL